MNPDGDGLQPLKTWLGSRALRSCRRTRVSKGEKISCVDIWGVSVRGRQKQPVHEQRAKSGGLGAAWGLRRLGWHEQRKSGGERKLRLLWDVVGRVLDFPSEVGKQCGTFKQRNAVTDSSAGNRLHGSRSRAGTRGLKGVGP